MGEKISRRKFLSDLVGALGAASVVAVPGEMFFSPEEAEARALGIGISGIGDGSRIYEYGSDGERYELNIKLHSITVQESDGTRRYRLRTTQGFSQAELNLPTGLTVDDQGRLYIADYGNGAIKVVSRDGKIRKTIGEHRLRYPRDLAFEDGKLFVAESGAHRISVFSSGGQFITKFGEQGTGARELNSPTGIAVSKSGDLFVADAGNSRISVFNQRGHFIDSIGGHGTQFGKFLYPRHLALDTGGRLYVSDSLDGSITVFSSAGKPLRRFHLKYNTQISKNILRGTEATPIYLARNSFGQIMASVRPKGPK